MKIGNGPRSWMIKWWTLGLALLLLWGVVPASAFAAPSASVKLEVSPGFDGSYGGPWVPVRVTVKNNGPDLEGEVEARLPDDNMMANETTPFQKVQVASGTTKEVTLLLPERLAYSDTRIELRVKGKIVASAKMGGDEIGEQVLTVGVLNDGAFRVPFLEDLSRDGIDQYSIGIYPLKREEIPAIGEGLSGLDVLVINNFPTETLSPSQRKAIHKWVQNGGTLLIAGGAGVTQSARGLESLLPIQLEGTDVLNDVNGLSKFGKVPSVEKLTVSKGRLVENGELIASQGDLPLIASRSFDQGKVVYAAYDLSAPPLAEWQENKKMWGEILFQGYVESEEIGDVFQERYFSLLEAVQHVPKLNLPSFGGMAILFLVYVLLIGPILYFLLSRFRRKEWGWWIIPACGVIVSLLIYVYGLEMRGNDPILHNVSVVKLDESGEARMRGASGLIAPKAGTFHLQTAPDTFGWPVSNHFPVGLSVNYDRVMTGSGKADIFFTNMNHWSMRTMFFDTTVKLGKLDANLTYKKNKLSGEIVNKTKIPLHNVQVVVGNKSYPVGVGKLAPGETVKVEIPYNPNKGVSISQGVAHQALNEHRERMLAQQLDNLDQDRGIMVTGWTEHPLVHHKVIGYTQKEKNLALVHAPVRIKPDTDGTVSWAPGLQRPSLIWSSAEVERSEEGYFFRDDGANSLVLEYQFHTTQRLEPRKIDITLQNTLKTEIYNWNRREWEDASGLVPMKGKNAVSYLSPNNQLRLRLTADHVIEEPPVSVEGKVIP